MKYKNLLVLLLISLHVPFLHAAQESQIQDEPFVIVPFDQFLDETVKNIPKIDQIFTFLHEQGCINTSFRQFLQARLNRDDVEDDVEDEANFGEVLGKAQDLITQNMQNRFIETLDTAMIKKKSLDKFHDPMFLYVMQHKDDSMRDMVHYWLYEWSTTEDDDGDVPLNLAAVNNNLEVAHLLINAGANRNLQDIDGETPLHWAIFCNNIEIAYLLIDTVANLNLQNRRGQTPLHLTSRKNIPDIARLLIAKKDVDINLQDYTGATPLHLAVSDNRQEIARLLIDADANLNLQNREGKTPLHLAVIYDYIEIVRLLIAKGADVNIQTNTGSTPLHSASSEVARLLIDAGANLNIKEKYVGDTPLHLAAFKNRPEIARLLIGACTDVNIQDNYGFTPLHHVGYHYDTEIARLLIAKGASLNIQDNYGRIAEQVAKTPEMRALFVQVRQDKDTRDMAIFENQIKKDWR